VKDAKLLVGFSVQFGAHETKKHTKAKLGVKG
jgi:hypothetical protein